MTKNLLLFILIIASALKSYSQSLVSISPDSAVVGTILTTTITASGTNFQSSSAPENIFFQNGPNNIYGDLFSIQILDDFNFTISFTIPPSAVTGVYDLHADVWTGFWPNFVLTPLTLPAAFTVLPSDGALQGKVFEDLNGNGVYDAGEPGITNQTINATGLGSQLTNASGDYSFGVANGNYTINFVSSTNDMVLILPPNLSSYNATVNNDTVINNFAAVYGLTDVYPDSAYIGQNIPVTIHSRGIFTPSNVAASNINLNRSTFPFNIPATQLTYVDSNTIIARFNIANQSSYLGLYNMRIYLSSGYTGFHYLRNCFTINNPPLYLNGIVFLDLDSNGIKDPSEPGIANEKIMLSPDSSFAFSDQNGDYSLGAAPGPHTITWVQQLPYLSLAPNNPASYTDTVNVTTGGHDFGLQSTFSPYTSVITLDPCWSGCAHPNHFGMVYQNIGSIPYNGYVYFVFDSNMIYSTTNCWGNSVAPDSIIGDTLFWNVYNVLPQTVYSLGVCFSTPVGGVTIHYSATIVALDGAGNVAYTATEYGTHVVSCSMDPNEKSVSPPGVYNQHYTLLSDSLVYTVIFQNTGTDTAYTVIIRDTIDSNLDLNSLKIIDASHPMLSEVSYNTRVAKFTFNNILLPDSNINEGQSHGFVKYLIRPVAGTSNNTIVYNDAAIYFDFNPPVITNQTYNTLVIVIPVAVSENNAKHIGAEVIPNPFSNSAWLVFDNPAREEFRLSVYTVTGELIMEKTVRENRVLIEKNNFQQGVYFFRLYQVKNANYTAGKFVIY